MKLGMKMFGAATLIVALAIGAALAQGPQPLGSLLPAPAEIKGWKADGAPASYDPETLWEYIDGSAETFLAYDFRGMIAQDYVSASNKGLKVEIYEHGSPLMAFGIYSQFRSPGVKLYDIGAEAFGDEYSIIFRKDRYYVRVAVFEKNPDLLAEAQRFAGLIAGKISAAGALPAEVCALPDEGIVPCKTTYLPANVLGYAELPPAFVGTYTFGDEQAKVYISALEDSASARKVFDWYTAKLGAASQPLEGPFGSYIRGTGNDPFQGSVTTFQYGKWLGIVTGLKTGTAKSDELVDKSIEKLAKIK